MNSGIFLVTNGYASKTQNIGGRRRDHRCRKPRTKLKKLGYELVGITSSGEEAIQKAEENHPDLVLMDINIEGNLDGIETAEVLRNRFHTPVIYLTAYADESTLDRANL